MRFMILDTCYPAFLRAHYAGHPGLERRSYAQQWQALMDTFFGTADSYSHALRALGHEAHEVVANCAQLQDAWGREHGVRQVGGPFGLRRERIVLAQASEHAPDVVYVQNLHAFSSRLLRQLRRRGARIVGQIATELRSTRRLRSFDLILTSFPHYVERFRKLGIDCEYLRIGFDPRILDRLEHNGAARDRYDVVFAGALNRSQRWAGNEMLERAGRRIPIDFWGYGAGGWPPGSSILERYHGEAWGIEMFRVLYGAKVALNRHGDVAGPFANNMRLFEATGVGTMLLTDEKRNLATLFEPGREVVTYSNEDELVEQAAYYLEHPDERRAIAKAGQERTLREHTYLERMKELIARLGASPG